VAWQLPGGDAGCRVRVERRTEFALEAFKSAFQRGIDLGTVDSVVDVGAQVGLDPDAVRAAIEDPQVKQALRAATDAAHDRGVVGVPTLAVDDELFWGDDRLEEAAALVR